MDTRTIAILEGDETGQELLEEAVRVLSPDATGLELELPRFDLSLDARRRTSNQVVHEAAAAVRDHGLGLKAATVTPEGKDDVGREHADRFLEQLLPGLVPFEDGDGRGLHAPQTSRVRKRWELVRPT